MSMRDDPFDLLARIRAGLDGIGRELGMTQGDTSLLDEASTSLASTIQRWSGNPSLRRLVGGVQRDVVTSEGENVEISASISPPLRTFAAARFYAGEIMLGEQAIGGRGEVRIVAPAPHAGLYDIRVEILDGSARIKTKLEGRRVLQVATGMPVAMVHADLILGPVAERTASALAELSLDTFELVYFDIHEKNREHLIDEAIERLGLPRAAIVVYSAQEQELASLGVDFVRMFATSAIRRLRASGVPVTTILTARHVPSRDSKAAQIRVLTPAAALQHMNKGELASDQHQAHALLKERSQCTALEWRLNQMTDSTLVTGNRFVAELDNRKARERIFAAIEEAQSTIHMQVYIVRPSSFAEQLVVRLIRRARADVKVRFMIDALYSEEDILGRLNPLMRSLRDEPNIDVLALKPITSRVDVSVARLKKRDHRKLIIIDNQRAFVSGRNASDEYFLGFDEVPVHDQTPHERIPWLDAHIEVEGPLVSAVQAAFAHTWRGHNGPDLGDLPTPPPSSKGHTSGRFVVHHGFADVNGLAMYEAMFDCAERHAYIVNDFPFVPTLERAVLRLLARGVVVKLLTGCASARRNDGSLFPAPMHRAAFEYLVKAKLEPLIEAGVEVYEFMPPRSPMVVSRGGRIRPYVHAKLVSIDGRATSIGSANLDGTASYWENEANVVVQDEDFAAGVEAELERLIAGSMRVDLDSDYWKSERAQRAVVATLWPRMVYS